MSWMHGMNQMNKGFAERLCVVSSIFALSMTLISGLAVAEEAEGPPNTFVEGQPIYADEVNENFENLHDRLLALEAILLGSGGGGDPTPVCTENCGVPNVPTSEGSVYAYVKDNQLYGADKAEPGILQATHKLVNGSGIVLELIAEGSLIAKDRRFWVLDHDVGPEKFNLESTVAIWMTPDESGQATLMPLDDIVSPQESAENLPLYNDNWYYESEDCSGEAFYQFANTGPNQKIFNFQGSIHRAPFPGDDSYRESIIAKSAYRSVGSGDPVVECVSLEYKTGPGGLPVPYSNWQNILELVGSGLTVVEL